MSLKILLPEKLVFMAKTPRFDHFDFCERNTGFIIFGNGSVKTKLSAQSENPNRKKGDLLFLILPYQ